MSPVEGPEAEEDDDDDDGEANDIVVGAVKGVIVSLVDGLLCET